MSSTGQVVQSRRLLTVYTPEAYNRGDLGGVHAATDAPDVPPKAYVDRNSGGRIRVSERIGVRHPMSKYAITNPRHPNIFFKLFDTICKSQLAAVPEPLLEI